MGNTGWSLSAPGEPLQADTRASLTAFPHWSNYRAEHDAKMLYRVVSLRKVDVLANGTTCQPTAGGQGYLLGSHRLAC